MLASLRGLVPARRVLFSEALHLAELQAHRLLELTDVSDGPVPSEIVSELPRIRVGYRRLPTSGMSYWDGPGRSWVIGINADEPPTRQRFTLLHEYKHIIDHGRTDQLYTGNQRVSAHQQAEQAADFFAGCVLMPKHLMKRAWGEGVQKPAELAEYFDVSPRAIEVRLAQLGLGEPTARCRRDSYLLDSQQRRDRYFRALSVNWPSPASILEMS